MKIGGIGLPHAAQMYTGVNKANQTTQQVTTRALNQDVIDNHKKFVATQNELQATPNAGNPDGIIYGTTVRIGSIIDDHA